MALLVFGDESNTLNSELMHSVGSKFRGWVVSTRTSPTTALQNLCVWRVPVHTYVRTYKCTFIHSTFCTCVLTPHAHTPLPTCTHRCSSRQSKASHSWRLTLRTANCCFKSSCSFIFPSSNCLKALNIIVHICVMCLSCDCHVIHSPFDIH